MPCSYLTEDFVKLGGIGLFFMPRCYLKQHTFVTVQLFVSFYYEVVLLGAHFSVE